MRSQSPSSSLSSESIVNTAVFKRNADISLFFPMLEKIQRMRLLLYGVPLSEVEKALGNAIDRELGQNREKILLCLHHRISWSKFAHELKDAMLAITDNHIEELIRAEEIRVKKDAAVTSFKSTLQLSFSKARQALPKNVADQARQKQNVLLAKIGKDLIWKERRLIFLHKFFFFIGQIAAGSVILKYLMIFLLKDNKAFIPKALELGFSSLKHFLFLPVVVGIVAAPFLSFQKIKQLFSLQQYNLNSLLLAACQSYLAKEASSNGFSQVVLAYIAEKRILPTQKASNEDKLSSPKPKKRSNREEENKTEAPTPALSNHPAVTWGQVVHERDSTYAEILHGWQKGAWILFDNANKRCQALDDGVKQEMIKRASEDSTIHPEAAKVIGFKRHGKSVKYRNRGSGARGAFELFFNQRKPTATESAKFGATTIFEPK